MWINKLDIRNLHLIDFVDDFNKTRQRFSDVILQEGRRPYRYSNASQKITSKLAEATQTSLSELRPSAKEVLT